MQKQVFPLRVFASLLAAGLILAGASVAVAGTNVWTNHGPYREDVYVLAIDPSTPSTLYAGTTSRDD